MSCIEVINLLPITLPLTPVLRPGLLTGLENGQRVLRAQGFRRAWDSSHCYCCCGSSGTQSLRPFKSLLECHMACSRQLLGLPEEVGAPCSTLQVVLGRERKRGHSLGNAEGQRPSDPPLRPLATPLPGAGSQPAHTHTHLAQGPRMAVSSPDSILRRSIREVDGRVSTVDIVQ